MKISFLPLAALALLGVSSATMASGASAKPPAQTHLTWRGDITTARGFVDDMASAWRHSGHPRMTLQPFNTISALDKLSAHQADIAGTARAGSPRKAKEKSLSFTPVAWDALVIITSRHNPVRSVTLKQLHDIYYGKIHNWSQLGGKNEPIHVYAVASPSDGVEYSLRKLLYGRGNQPVAAPRLYINVKSLEQGVALDPAGLGVSTLSGVHGNGKLRMLAIDNTKPTPANIADGSYPLSTPLYLVTRKDENNPTAQAFISFTQSDTGQRILHKHLLLPYAQGSHLAQTRDDRMARIADAVGRVRHNGPTAAPRATYSSRAAVAPTSERTRAARDRMLNKRDREQENNKAQAKSNQANAKATEKAKGK